VGEPVYHGLVAPVPEKGRKKHHFDVSCEETQGRTGEPADSYLDPDFLEATGRGEESGHRLEIEPEKDGKSVNQRQGSMSRMWSGRTRETSAGSAPGRNLWKKSLAPGRFWPQGRCRFGVFTGGGWGRFDGTELGDVRRRHRVAGEQRAKYRLSGRKNTTLPQRLREREKGGCLPFKRGGDACVSLLFILATVEKGEAPRIYRR